MAWGLAKLGLLHEQLLEVLSRDFVARAHECQALWKRGEAGEAGKACKAMSKASVRHVCRVSSGPASFHRCLVLRQAGRGLGGAF